MYQVPTCFRDELIFLGDSCKKFECDVRIYVFNIKKVCTELEINQNCAFDDSPCGYTMF